MKKFKCGESGQYGLTCTQIVEERQTGDVRQIGDLRQTGDMRQTGNVRQTGNMRQTIVRRRET